MRTYKVIFCITVLYFIMSCGMLKNSTKSSAEESREYANESALAGSTDQRQSKESESLIFYSDSTNHAYQVQLWPKGPFKFSAATGFEGEAERMLFSGNLRGSKKSTESVTSKTERTDHAQLNVQSKEKAKSEKTSVLKKTTPSVWWVIGGLGLLLILVTSFINLKS